MGKAYNQDMAKQFAQDEKHIADIIYSKEWRVFFKREGNYYRQLDTYKEFKGMVRKYTIANFPNQNHTDHVFEDIIKQLRFDIVRQYETVNTEYIALNDKLLNTETLELEENDIEKIAIHKIRVDSQDLEKPTPHFTKYLNSTIVKPDKITTDYELIELVQEMFGYVLMPHLKGEAMFFLVGSGSNGKSIMLKLLEEFVGKDYTSAMSIQYLTTNNFACHNLIGKRLNIGNEEESKFTKVDKLKALVTGDAVMAEQKGRDAFLISPTTKFIYAQNKTIVFDSIDNGLKRRVKIIPFNKQFNDEDKDKDLLNKLTSEIGGILWWSLQGAKRLKENNYNFSRPEQFKQALARFEEEISAPIRFFNENYEIRGEEYSDTATVLKIDELYKEYTEWCDRNGRKHNNKDNFELDLKKIEGFEESKGRKYRDGVQVRGYILHKKYQDELFEEIRNTTLDEITISPDDLPY